MNMWKKRRWWQKKPITITLTRNWGNGTNPLWTSERAATLKSQHPDESTSPVVEPKQDGSEGKA